ncbi:MAG: hypothetical protein HY721_11565 [Planctomycetes bacterium]|nr:hypothetical protein [Planctomycetota bacterium]
MCPSTRSLVLRRSRMHLGLLVIAGQAAGQEGFVRGDLNLNGHVTLADASFYFDYRFLGGQRPGCQDAADSNDTGVLDSTGIAEGQFLLDWLFRSAAPQPLPAPFPAAGTDPTSDRLTCAVAASVEPLTPRPGYAMAWEVPADARSGQKDLELFLLATTDAAIESFSIAYRINTAVLENVRADLQGTIVPASLAAALAADGTFRVLVRPSGAPQVQLLLAGAVFATPAGTGTGYERPAFAATTGPLSFKRLLRVVADVRAGAMLGAGTVLLAPALPEDLVVSGDLAHGLQNEYGGQTPAGPGGSNLAAAVPAQILFPGEEFIRADANADGEVNISDALAILGYLFLGSIEPVCLDAADADDKGSVDISDASYTLGYLFLGTGVPPSPGPKACGLDPTLDQLLCYVKVCHCDPEVCP